MKIDFDETRPIYLQIMEEIRRALIRGEIGKGNRMASVRELAEELRVNPNTVSRAYMELEREGLLVTRRGQGTFATEEEEKIGFERKAVAEKTLRHLLKELRALGFGEEEIRKTIEKVLKE